MTLEWTEREKRLYDALNHAIDYIGDGSPDEGYSAMMTEARAAMKDMRIVPSKAAQVLELLRNGHPHRELYLGQDRKWYITHGGGYVPASVVEEIVSGGQVKSVYSNSPSAAYHVGPTLDVEATRALRKTPGHHHSNVYK